VERGAPSALDGREIRLQLRLADFTTAARITSAINGRFAPDRPIARTSNSALVSVVIPEQFAGRPADFVADLENLLVQADRPARVIINERTGTIVMGKEVRIAPIAIMHGALTVEIQTSYAVSQPPGLSSGTTEVVPKVDVGVNHEPARNVVLKQGATVEELVKGLNAIGSTARDIIAILQSLRAAGALTGEVEVI
jgi:flagellar P-ring protein precursor FlgI